MKPKPIKAVLLIFASIIAFACSRNDNEPTELPSTAYIFFDIKKSDGINFEEGDITYKQGLLNYNQEWWYDQDWHLMEKRYLPHQEKDFFTGEMYYIVKPFEEGDGWLKQKQYILKYLDTEVIDTLWVKDSVAYPNYHKIDIFLNGELYHTYQSYDELIVQITKEDF
jgi:hypothetical protein